MKNQKGFTLIESLIYLALFTLIIGGGMVATYQIVESTNAGANHILLQEEADFLMRKVHWALTGITAVGVGPNTLSTTKIISGTSVQIIITADGTNVTLQRPPVAAVALNSSSISASNLTFANIPQANGKPQGVNASFTLTTVQNGRPATQNFSFIKYLRK